MSERPLQSVQLWRLRMVEDDREIEAWLCDSLPGQIVIVPRPDGTERRARVVEYLGASTVH